MTTAAFAAKRDIYQEVTDRIVASLEAGVAPWIKPWTGKAGFTGNPYNAATGRAYNGINILILGTLPYATPAFLTFKQAKALGGSVRKGEKGTLVVFWQFLRRKDEATGKESVIPFAKGYTVFNVEQCEGLDPAKLVLPKPPVSGETSVNEIAARVGAVVKHGGDRAFYAIVQDSITVPSVEDFRSVEHYQSTLAHELVHWTGHESRCKRDFRNRFGNEAYAFEELVAEIGSAFVCSQIGVPLDGLQHADYIGNWLKVLKNDKRAIFSAASAAKKAAQFLLPAAEEEAEEEEKVAA